MSGGSSICSAEDFLLCDSFYLGITGELIVFDKNVFCIPGDLIVKILNMFLVEWAAEQYWVSVY